MIIKPYDHTDIPGILKSVSSLQDLNQILEPRRIQFLTYQQYYDQLIEDEKAWHPKELEFSVRIHPLHFGRYDEEKRLTMIIVKESFLNECGSFGHTINRLVEMLDHESIHVQQHQRQAPEFKKDYSKANPFEFKLEYLKDKDEIMAFAYSAVSMSNNTGVYTIQNAMATQFWWGMYFHTDQRTRRKFLKYLYLYLIDATS